MGYRKIVPKLVPSKETRMMLMNMMESTIRIAIVIDFTIVPSNVGNCRMAQSAKAHKRHITIN